MCCLARRLERAVEAVAETALNWRHRKDLFPGIRSSNSLLQQLLSVEPTVVVPPEIHLAQTGTLGDPLSSILAMPSNGIGSGGGIGSGSGGGIGSGRGPGVGPGWGGGIGGGVYHSGGGVTSPRVICAPETEFSEEARKNKYQGVVVLSIVVGADGGRTIFTFNARWASDWTKGRLKPFAYGNSSPGARTVFQSLWWQMSRSVFGSTSRRSVHGDSYWFVLAVDSMKEMLRVGFIFITRSFGMKHMVQVLILAFLCAAAVAQLNVPAPRGTAATKKSTDLPPILREEQLWPARKPYQRLAYKLAAANSELLLKLPCMCHCERMGHASLRNCFESLHAADCYVCMKEVFYADMEQKSGKTTAQIRDGILRSEHNKVQIDEATGEVWR